MSRRKSRAAAAPRAAARLPDGASGPSSVLIGLVLVALNLAVYAQARTFGFVNWDDPSYLTENPNVTGGLTWSSAWWALTTGYSPYWHPLTWLSHLLDVQLFGMDAGWHHLTSVAIHSLTTVLLFLVFRRMTRDGWPSALLAALFAVHPLHVESVVWIAERKDVLSTLCWVLTLLAYVAYVRAPGWRRYLPVMGLFGLALMAKPMVVTLPVVLLLLDVWPLERVRLATAAAADWRRLVIEKVPLLVLALVTSGATIAVQHRIGAMARFDALPWTVRATNAVVAYVEYLAKALWPAGLAAFYPYHAYAWWQVTGAALILIGLSLAALWQRNRRPYLIVGWVWFLVTLAPVIGLLQAGEQRIADRFMYVPLIGLSMAVIWGVRDVVRATTPARRTLLAGLSGALVAACAVAASAQTSHWTDSVALWQHATRVTPDSYIAFENLGQALRERGQFDESIANYRQALSLAPAGSPAYQAVIHNSLGLVLTRQGRDDQAAVAYTEAARLNPSFAEAQSNLANTLAATGRFKEAVEHYQAAVRLKSDFTEALVGLGSALLQDQRPVEAQAAYRDALRADPRLAEAHNGLGAALAMQGQDAAALPECLEALRLKPALPTAHLNIAALLIKGGRLDEARTHLQTALAIDPGYQPARALLERLAAQ
ncbi:MAG: tetratricopeptide repeat protein [Vicinamibacterales bacterium]